LYFSIFLEELKVVKKATHRPTEPAINIIAVVLVVAVLIVAVLIISLHCILQIGVINTYSNFDKYDIFIIDL
jgi:hypothetical protein